MLRCPRTTALAAQLLFRARAGCGSFFSASCAGCRRLFLSQDAISCESTKMPAGISADILNTDKYFPVTAYRLVFFRLGAGRVKVKRILNLMRRTHGNGICYNIHFCIKYGNRDLKDRITFCIYRLVRFSRLQSCSHSKGCSAIVAVASSPLISTLAGDSTLALPVPPVKTTSIR